MMRFRGWMISLVLSCVLSTNVASAQSPSPGMPSSQSGNPPLANENEGGDETLLFLLSQRVGEAPSVHSRLYLDTRSLFDGWVAIEQCHEGLDAEPVAKMVYDFQAVRDLRVIEARDIGKAWVEGQSVQMKSVGKGARLCVSMQAMLMEKVDAGVYRMQYGPFQRRRFDNYFPMHVSVELDTAKLPLQLDAITPDPALGYTVQRNPSGVEIEAWFRGKLTFDMQFRLPGHKR